jgi:hypothetical protein
MKSGDLTGDQNGTTVRLSGTHQGCFSDYQQHSQPEKYRRSLAKKVVGD